jgi:L-fuconolactonase
MTTLHQRRLPSGRADWLALRQEKPLDPSLTIIDSHQHLWDFENNKYLVDDYLADAADGHAIAATVYVQAFCAYRKTGPLEFRVVGETEHAVRLGREGERRNSSIRIAAAIVGHADLTLADQVERVLEEHVAAGQGRFRGIRPITARDDFVSSPLYDPPAPDVIESKKFRQGALCLQRLGLSLDCYVFYHQLAQLASFARSVPELRIAVNHTGGVLGVGPHANRRDAIFETWRCGIAALGRCENVYMKLGGMGMTVWGFEFNTRALPPTSLELADAWRPYVETCIEMFGASRCMFEANFPMDKASFGYSTGWNAFQRLAEGATEGQRAALFHETARRFYEISL